MSASSVDDRAFTASPSSRQDVSPVPASIPRAISDWLYNVTLECDNHEGPALVSIGGGFLDLRDLLAILEWVWLNVPTACDEAVEWAEGQRQAIAIEAGTAETVKLGSVHESAVPERQSLDEESLIHRALGSDDGAGL